MAQKWKIDKINELKEELKDYSNFLFANYRGLNVEQINNLRNNLREKGAEFHVVKNRFMKRVFNELGHENLDQFLVDPTALTYFNVDLSEIAKLLVEASQDTTLGIKGGYTDGTIFMAEDLEAIAKLPPKQVLIGQVIGLLNSPLADFVHVLNGTITKFIRTLKAIELIKSEQSEPRK